MQSATNNNVSLLGAGTSDAQQLLLSLPVIVNNAIDDHAGLVIDSRAVVSAVGTVQVASSLSLGSGALARWTASAQHAPHQRGRGAGPFGHRVMSAPPSAP
jgi:hypothetical protein